MTGFLRLSKPGRTERRNWEAEEPEIKWPTSTGSRKKQESSRKTPTSALLTMPKPLTVCPVLGVALPTLRAPESRSVPVYSISQPPQQLSVKNKGDTSTLVSPPGHVTIKFHHFQGPGVPPLDPPSAHQPSSACVPLPGVGSQVWWACGRCPHVEGRQPSFWGKFILPCLESPVGAGEPFSIVW